MKGQRPAERLVDFVERLIQEAQADGAFEGLPGAGKPLPYRGPRDEAWWIKEKVRRERLSALPDAIAIRHEAEALAASLPTLSDERVVRERLLAMNARIRRLNATVVSGPPTTLAPFDVEAAVARWRTARAAPRPQARSSG
jgi:hypothetical protein